MSRTFFGVSAFALAAALAHAASAADEAPPPAAQVVVTAQRPIDELGPFPATTETVTAAQIADTTNLVTVADTLRYLPDILVRERHFGDTQAPITTRTSGVGASARSLIYVDGVLISALIGNNNTNASPRWGLVAPDAVARADVLYGPFSAAYPGNSIGAVVELTTRMPTRFEATAEVQGATQMFSKYGDDRTLGAGRIAASIGDRIDRFSFRLSYNHLETEAQPLTYATSAVPSAASGAGTTVTGAYLDANRTGTPIAVLGSSGIERQSQDNLSARLAYDLTPALTAAYTLGLFRNDDDAGVNSYLRDASGASVYAGTLNIGGRAYTVAASAFSNGIYHLEEEQLAQGLSLASHTGGVFDFQIVGSTVDYLKSRQRVPSGALPEAFSGGAGSTTSLDGTGWWTLDARGTWRPGFGHELSFGAHGDGFKLNNPKYALSDWIDGSAGATLSYGRGRTETQALWLQDDWRMSPVIKATLGGRWEHWDAYDGLNYSASPALNAVQPALSDWRFSPKAVLAFTPQPGWTFKASLGQAYRFPTVTELYQAVTTGNALTVPNPNLRPEDALSGELSAERSWTGGRVRLSLFGERIRDALLSQSAPLVAGSSVLYSYVQNVDEVRTSGVELVAEQADVGLRHLDLSGWITYVDSKIAADAAFPAAVGKDQPQLPRLRAEATATYAPIPPLTLSLSGRYSDRSYGTLDNSDSYADAYTGFSAYFVLDAHVRYQIDPHLTAELGVDNLNDRSYFLYHPFPQRTVIAGLKYAY